MDKALPQVSCKSWAPFDQVWCGCSSVPEVLMFCRAAESSQSKCSWQRIRGKEALWDSKTSLDWLVFQASGDLKENLEFPWISIWNIFSIVYNCLPNLMFKCAAIEPDFEKNPPSSVGFHQVLLSRLFDLDFWALSPSQVIDLYQYQFKPYSTLQLPWNLAK